MFVRTRAMKGIILGGSVHAAPGIQQDPGIGVNRPVFHIERGLHQICQGPCGPVRLSLPQYLFQSAAFPPRGNMLPQAQDFFPAEAFSEAILWNFDRECALTAEDAERRSLITVHACPRSDQAVLIVQCCNGYVKVGLDLTHSE